MSTRTDKPTLQPVLYLKYKEEKQSEENRVEKNKNNSGSGLIACASPLCGSARCFSLLRRASAAGVGCSVTFVISEATVESNTDGPRGLKHARPGCRVSICAVAMQMN